MDGSKTLIKAGYVVVPNPGQHHIEIAKDLSIVLENDKIVAVG